MIFWKRGIFVSLAALFCAAPIQAKYLESSGRPDSEIIEELKNSPARLLDDDTQTQEFLKKHSIYMSLTTIPSRIETIGKTLSTIDTSKLKKIFLILPQAGKNGEKIEYDLPSDLDDLEKLVILKPKNDLGPISKLVPAIEHLQAADPSGYLITIDDDIAYSYGLVNEYIVNFKNYPERVIAASTPKITGWSGTNTWLWPYKGDDGDLIEGFAGVGYPVAKIKTSMMKELASLNDFSRFSDDVVIGFSMAATNVDIKHVNTIYHSAGRVWPLSFGHREDALHRGRGLGIVMEDANPLKYSKTIESIFKSKIGSPLRVLKDLIPYEDKRRKSLFLALNLMRERNAKILVETGTARNGLTECVGDGCSTAIFSRMSKFLGADFTSVDIDSENIEVARAVVAEGSTNFVEDDSVSFLNGFEGNIDFLYLDSLDYEKEDPIPSQEHQLRELRAAFKKLHSKSIVLLDDCQLPSGGKCRLANQYLAKKGWVKYHEGYQCLWVSKK